MPSRTIAAFIASTLIALTSCAYHKGEPAGGGPALGASPGLAAPVPAAEGGAESTPTSLKAVLASGWDVPGLSESRAEKPCRTPEVLGTSSRTITCTILKPRREVITEVNRYVLGKDGALHLFPNKWLVVEIREYDAGGRKFCYVVDASLVKVEGPGKAVIRYTASSSLFYCDEDGDGRFETFEHGWGQTVKTNVPTVPDWARGGN